MKEIAETKQKERHKRARKAFSNLRNALNIVTAKTGNRLESPERGNIDKLL